MPLPQGMATVVAVLGKDTPEGDLTVMTSYGPLKGGSDGTARFWRGIRYASAGRFAAPGPPASWQYTRPATSPGPICPQPALFGHVPPADLDQSEDCLTLRVFAPLHAPTRVTASGARKAKPMPVLVLLAGGVGAGGHTVLSPAAVAAALGAPAPAAVAGAGMAVGWAGEAGALAATTQSLVVTVNYRVGPLGFLSHPGLRATQGWSGNLGLLDQAAALQWVRANAAAFGGDPDDVTLVGVGAGATAALLHLSLPASAGLARAVVAVGGSVTSNGTITPATAADADGVRFATAAGCTAKDPLQQAHCLASLPVSALTTAAASPAWAWAWGPVQDGAYLRGVDAAAVFQNTLDLQAATTGLVLGAPSNFAATPLHYLLNGPTAPLQPARPVLLSSAQVGNITQRHFAGVQGGGQAVHHHYAGILPPLTPAPSAANVQWLARVLSDSGGVCAARRLARAAWQVNGGASRRTDSGGAVTGFLLTLSSRLDSVPAGWGQGGAGDSLLPLLLQQARPGANATMPAPEVSLGAMLGQALAGLSAAAPAGGNMTVQAPMAGGQRHTLAWSAWAPGQQAWLDAALPLSTVSSLPGTAAQCDFWDAVTP